MRIQSKFQDYYDSGLAYGQDEKVVYVRARQEYLRPTTPDAEWMEHSRHFGDLFESRRAGDPRFPVLRVREHVKPYTRHNAASVGIVFFCGRLYPFYAFQVQVEPDPQKPPVVSTAVKYENHFMWDEDFASKVYQSDWDAKYHGAWRDFIESQTGRPTLVNEQFKSPIVAYLPHWLCGSFAADTLVVNPCLKDIRFNRVIDPYAAFQDITMYIGSVLNNVEPPPAPQTDVEKAVSHGHDSKYSFRTPPRTKA